MKKSLIALAIPTVIFANGLNAQPQYYNDPYSYYGSQSGMSYYPPAAGNDYYRSYDPYYGRQSYDDYRRPGYDRRYDKPRKKKKKKKFGFGKFNFDKDSMRDFWDDSWKEPGSWGRMPGGWTFPELTLPNPVDTADDFEKGIRDLPEGFKQGDDEPKKKKYKSRRPKSSYGNRYPRERYQRRY